MQVEKDPKKFHETRRMFAIINEKLEISTDKDQRSHDQWFVDEGWITSESDPKYEEIIRGMVNQEGEIWFYVGKDLTTNQKVEETFLRHVRELVKRLHISNEAKIFAGMIRGPIGTKWTPRKELGVVKNFAFP